MRLLVPLFPPPTHRRTWLTAQGALLPATDWVRSDGLLWALAAKPCTRGKKTEGGHGGRCMQGNGARPKRSGTGDSVGLL